MPRPILLLDVMSTLVTEPFLENIPAFFGMSLEELMAVKHPTAWVEFEHGHIDEATYAARFFRDGRGLDLDAFKAMIRASYAYMEGVEALLGELKAEGYAMHALSNYSSWYRIIEEELGLSRYLEWSFVSCDTGVRKPAPEAYLGAAQRLGVPPSRCLFIDDRRSNVAAAEAVGMLGLLRHRDIERFRAELAALGIL